MARGRCLVLGRGRRSDPDDRPRSLTGKRPPTLTSPSRAVKRAARCSPDSLSADPPGLDADLQRRVEFLLELDKAKGVLRRNLITAEERRENDAEARLARHHVCPGAAPTTLLRALDIARVIVMLLVHDIVEIDAGDAFVYDEEAKALQPARERAARRPSSTACSRPGQGPQSP